MTNDPNIHVRIISIKKPHQTERYYPEVKLPFLFIFKKWYNLLELEWAKTIFNPVDKYPGKVYGLFEGPYTLDIQEAYEIVKEYTKWLKSSKTEEKIIEVANESV